MNGLYYTLPIRFSDITTKKDLSVTNLEQSIAQNINLVLTTSYGECKFNESFGCNIWETDFDLLTEHTDLKLNIQDALFESIERFEQRLEVQEVNVSISEEKVTAVDASFRLKKKVDIVVAGTVKKTNRPFNFYGYFYLGPLSYR